MDWFKVKPVGSHGFSHDIMKYEVSWQFPALSPSITNPCPWLLYVIIAENANVTNKKTLHIPKHVVVFDTCQFFVHTFLFLDNLNQSQTLLSKEV